MTLGDAVSVCSELDAKLVEIVTEFEKYQDIMNGLGECLRQVSEWISNIFMDYL